MLATIDNKAFSELMLALYGATGRKTEPQQCFLTCLKNMLDLQQVTIIYRSSSSTQDSLIYTSGDGNSGDRLVDRNLTAGHFFQEDPLGNLPYKRFTLIEEVIPRADLLKSDLYQNRLEPMDIYYMAGIDWRYRGGTRLCARFTRSQSQGQFGNREINLLNLLVPHLEQFTTLFDKIRQLDAERQLYADAISKQAVGILTLDEQGLLVQCNRTGHSILSLGDGIALQERKIAFTDRGIQQQFQRHMEYLYSGYAEPKSAGNAVASYAMSVPRNSGKPAYQLVIKTLSGHCQPIVLLKDPQAHKDISVRVLMELYQLTMSEASIAMLLAEGLAREQIADAMGIRLNTVRAHMRSTYAKMGVSRQSMLVSLVISSLATVT